ncbi:MAG TPA: methyltransferase [Acidimicrobiia bacterium]|nr:methyltransferase [Acidimicrobiia bacterium]
MADGERASRPRLPPPWAVAPLFRVRHALAGVHRRTGPPVLTVLDASLGMMQTRALAIVADLGVADALGARRRTPDDLATAVGADADALGRVLRFLAARGIFRQDRRGRWRNNGASSLLRAEHPDSLRSWIRFQGAPWHFAIWQHADASVRTGASASVAATGADYFDWLTSTPDAQRVFDDAMAETSRLVGPALLAGYDFSAHRSVCDVGGGNGSLIALVLEAHPNVRGVVYDLPAVVAAAPDRLAAAGVIERAEVVAGDFFASVPVGHDCYVLKAIVHDWDDESCLRILGHVRDALPDGGRVVVVDQIVPDGRYDTPALATDLEMLVLTGRGRERTAAEFDGLFARAGFRVERRQSLSVAWAQVLVADRDRTRP